MYQDIKRLFFKAEKSIGKAVGSILRMGGWPGFHIYLFICRCAWLVPNRGYAILDPFLVELGAALFFHSNAPVVRERRYPWGVSMQLDLSEKTQRLLFSQKQYEHALSQFLISYLKPGDSIIDVGANVGYFSLLAAARVGTHGNVFAFEPEKHNYEGLCANVTFNHLPQVHTYQYALGASRANKQPLYINPLNRGGNSMHAFETYRAGDASVTIEHMKNLVGEQYLKQEVTMRTLDDVWKELGKPKIKFLKIDVEGFESEVLVGAHELLQSGQVESVVCEISNREQRSGILSTFRSCGYTAYTFPFSGPPVLLEDTSGARDVLFLLN